jgi:hypothetical protein
VTSDATSLHVAYTPAATRILVSGLLSLDAVQRLDNVLRSLPDDHVTPVLLRLTSTEVEFGAGDALRRVLTVCRRLGPRHLAVWADEPLVRRGIPVALLHAKPPGTDGDWASAVPPP